MKYKMKSLRHNGVYVPTYDYKGFSVKIRGHYIKLSPETEQMAVAMVKKLKSVSSPPDKSFYRNFVQDFLIQLKCENPSLDFLNSFFVEYMKGRYEKDFEVLRTCNNFCLAEIGFSLVHEFLEDEKLKKINMTKTEKKELAKQKKSRREALREKFGTAVVDGREVEVSNWTAEPSCIFVGRGTHSKRGRWKKGPKEEAIILNHSPDSPKPLGNWKDIVWEPDKMYLAKWRDKLSGKIKYVWFSDSAFVKQMKE